MLIPFPIDYPKYYGACTPEQMRDFRESSSAITDEDRNAAIMLLCHAVRDLRAEVESLKALIPAKA